jgi:hypothetical protein
LEGAVVFRTVGSGEPNSFEIPRGIDFLLGVFYLLWPEFDLDAVFAENVRHVEPGDASRAALPRLISSFA